MRSRTLCVGIALFSCSTLLCAQQGLTGSYKGRFSIVDVPGDDPLRLDATMEITSAENGKLAGKFKISSASIYICVGDYSVQGTYNDNKIEMSTSAGRVRGCGNEPLVLIVQGNKLVGTLGGAEIELEKKIMARFEAPQSCCVPTG